MIEKDEAEYWNSYYSNLPLDELQVPSQFAAFVASECKKADMIIDVGCGNGRDSIFFANFFGKVAGVDASEAAVDFCRRFAQANAFENTTFSAMSVADDKFNSHLAVLLENVVAGSAIVYSRFFLHALTDDQESALFDALARNLRQGDRLALEYRTVRDASGAKSTAAHYRRFVSPPEVFSKLEKRGFGVDYSAEGFGMAKYKVDDAYVARSLHTRI